MTLRKIALLGHPVLDLPALPVADPTDPEIQRLIADMQETLPDAGGIGLAAPQVYAPLRVVLLHNERGKPEGEPATVLINPTLEPLDDAMELGIEGCLSIPDYVGLVPRHTRVHFNALDETGHAIEGDATGFHARVLQHEVDHLDGILYPARLSDTRHLAHRSQARHLQDLIENQWTAE